MKTNMSTAARIAQFRDYAVKPGEMEEWLDEWRAKLYPLRTKRGFRIMAAWVVPESNRFLWIIRWDGKGSFEDADRAYYASQERKAVSPNPARHLEKAEHFYIEPILEDGTWKRKNPS
jgi:heme-degrading monooxygenase HmoA